MPYQFIVASWRSEPYIVIRPCGQIIYADACEATARAVCDGLNRLSQSKT